MAGKGKTRIGKRVLGLECVKKCKNKRLGMLTIQMYSGKVFYFPLVSEPVPFPVNNQSQLLFFCLFFFSYSALCGYKATVFILQFHS